MITSERCQLFYEWFQVGKVPNHNWSTYVWSKTLDQWPDSKDPDRWKDVQDCVYFWELWSDFVLRNSQTVEMGMSEFSDVAHQVGDGVFGRNKSFFKTSLGKMYLKINNPRLLRDVLIEEIFEND